MTKTKLLIALPQSRDKPSLQNQQNSPIKQPMNTTHVSMRLNQFYSCIEPRINHPKLLTLNKKHCEDR